MRASDLRWALATPVLAYAVLRVLVESPPWGLTTALVIVALAVPFLDIAPARLGVLGFLPAALVGGAALVAASGTYGDPAAALGPYVVGSLLGAPLLFLAVTARARRSVGGGILTVTGAIALAALLLAVAQRLPGGATPVDPVGWSHVVRSVLVDQGAALSSFAAGGSVPPAPLGYVGDPGFDLLALLGFLGLVGSFYADPEPPDDGAPSAWAGFDVPVERAGAASFVGVVATVGAVELVATTDPGIALGAVVVGMVVAVALVAYAARPGPDRTPGPRPG